MRGLSNRKGGLPKAQAVGRPLGSAAFGPVNHPGAAEPELENTMKRMLLQSPDSSLEYENTSEEVRIGVRLSNSSFSWSEKEIAWGSSHY